MPLIACQDNVNSLKGFQTQSDQSNQTQSEVGKKKLARLKD